ncbi:hypothetical protein C4553_02175 [Candidatus Parcubacteria bacterium]|nr:MAG: hypothetical protein C4553_02175 [Candidatus Parcubacteria bacterium]
MFKHERFLNKISGHKKSFSLVEVLVAVSVLLLGTVGVMSLLATAITTAASAQSNLIAAYLAQEGIEIIRKIRDENFIANKNMDQQIPGGGSRRVDWIQAGASPGNQLLGGDPQQNKTTPNYGSCTKLKYDPIYGYNYSFGTDSVFCRNIYITKNTVVSTSSTDELIIEAQVVWSQRGFVKHFIAENHLIDWR